MLRHNPRRTARVVRIGILGEFLNLRKDSREELRLIDRLHALHECGHALHAHARVHIGFCERNERPVRRLVVLHEDVVPDFNPLAAFAGWTAIRSAVGFVDGDEHLRIGSAGSRLSRRTPPVVLLREKIDVLLWNPLRLPDFRRLRVARSVLVACKAGHLDLLGSEAQLLRQELEAHRDRLLLEVVAERPVAEHLEEGQMEGIAHLVDVPRPQAFLHIGQTRSRRVLLPQQIGDERMHPRRREQTGRVILRNQ